MAKKRDYRAEYLAYGGTTEQKKRRAKRNAARRQLMREGKVHKGDGKDVDHKDSNPNNNSRNNLRVQDRSENRSFPRTKDAKEKRGGKNKKKKK